MGYFDDLDVSIARQKPVRPIKLEPAKEGDHCPGPRCDGRIKLVTRNAGLPSEYTVLACTGCGTEYGGRTP